MGNFCNHEDEEEIEEGTSLEREIFSVRRICHLSDFFIS